MAAGEFLLHKKLSWYESDKSSMVSSHVNSFQSLLHTGNRAGENVVCWILQEHVRKKSTSIFHLAASPSCKTFPWQNSLSFYKRPQHLQSITADVFEHQSLLLAGCRGLGAEQAPGPSCGWEQSGGWQLLWQHCWQQFPSPHPGCRQEKGRLCHSIHRSPPSNERVNIDVIH